MSSGLCIYIKSFESFFTSIIFFFKKTNPVMSNIVMQLQLSRNVTMFCFIIYYFIIYIIRTLIDFYFFQKKRKKKNRSSDEQYCYTITIIKPYFALLFFSKRKKDPAMSNIVTQLQLS